MKDQTITNEMLYDLMKEFKADGDRRFREMTEVIRDHKTETDRRFQEVIELIRDHKTETDRKFQEVIMLIREDKQKLQEVYDSRDRVTVQFTRAWSLASFFIAFGSSALVLILSRL